MRAVLDLINVLSELHGLADARASFHPDISAPADDAAARLLINWTPEA